MVVTWQLRLKSELIRHKLIIHPIHHQSLDGPSAIHAGYLEAEPHCVRHGPKFSHRNQTFVGKEEDLRFHRAPKASAGLHQPFPPKLKFANLPGDLFDSLGYFLSLVVCYISISGLAVLALATVEPALTVASVKTAQTIQSESLTVTNR